MEAFTGESRIEQGILGEASRGRGYFVASTGNVTEEMIAQYIENQQEMKRDKEAEFKVEP